MADLHEYLDGANLMPTTPHPITKETIPLTMGHEISAIVEEVGEGVSDVKIGARVVLQPLIYDGTCGACRAGYINCCEKNGGIGLSGRSSSPFYDEADMLRSGVRWRRRTIGAYGGSSRYRHGDSG